jgi:hypothetical protein
MHNATFEKKISKNNLRQIFNKKQLLTGQTLAMINCSMS